jgi:hypothetical protein
MMAWSEKAIWDAARVIYLNVNSIMEACDAKWDAERRARGQRWFDIAKSALDAAAAVDGDAQWNTEHVAKALWTLDCERSAEDYRREKRQVPEKFADPWHESGCGIRQQQRYMREAETFLTAIRSLKRSK